MHGEKVGCMLPVARDIILGEVTQAPERFRELAFGDVNNKPQDKD